MRVFCIIFRKTLNGWCACRFNVPEYDAMKQQDPAIKLRILKITEEVIAEDT